MYVVCGLGLWLLWGARSEHAAAGQDRRLFGAGLIGFGGWHILDSVLSHWILGIHRVRMDTDNPLFWDLLWLVLFGIVPCIIGWMIRSNGTGGPRRSHAPLILTLAVAVTAPIASLPPPRDTTVMVLFAPGTTPNDAFAALRAVDARLLWTDPTETLWAVDLTTGGEATRLYRHGALLVTSSILPLGCFNWIKT
jgi:hypothetical protein